MSDHIIRYYKVTHQIYPVAWSISEGRQGPAGQSRPSSAMAKSTKRIAFGAYQPSSFRLAWLRLSVIFLSCNAKARVYDTKSGHGPYSPHPQARRLHLSACKMSLLCSASLGSEPAQPTKQRLSLPQLESCHLGAKFWQDQSKPSTWLQNR